jgi:transposase-like protein
MSQGRGRARVFSTEFKLGAVKRALAGERVAEIAEELGIRRKLVYAWKDIYAELGEAGLARTVGPPKRSTLKPPPEPAAGRGELLAARKRIAELERKVGQQELELDFFVEALRRIGADGKRSVPSSPNARRKADWQSSGCAS